MSSGRGNPICDEVHRLNKDKQDFLLPHVEDGSILLIGATTANPYHSINPAIRSSILSVAIPSEGTVSAWLSGITSDGRIVMQFVPVR